MIMLDNVVFKLVLVLIWNTAAAMKCRQPIPASCTSNTNIELTLTQKKDYYLLQLCSNGQCIPGIEKKWIKCDKMCEACESMDINCGTNEEDCEIKVSTFLDNYCSSNTPSTSTQTVTTTARITATPSVLTTTNIQTVTKTQPCPTITRITTVHVTASPTCSVTTTSNTPSTSTQTVTTTVTVQRITTTNTQIITETLPCPTLKGIASQTCSVTAPDESRQEHNGNKNELVVSANGLLASTILGVLFGLSMVLLVVVTTGWVWTLWKMKKKKSEKASSNDNTSNESYTEEHYFQNPTYGEVSTMTPVPVTPNQTGPTYDVVTLNKTTSETSENGQNYSKLNRAERNGGHRPKPASGGHNQQADNYSKLDIQDCSLAGKEEDEMDAANKDNVTHHVLEAHGGDDYADPDMEVETMGGATEYEVPVLQLQDSKK